MSEQRQQQQQQPTDDSSTKVPDDFTLSPELAELGRGLNTTIGLREAIYNLLKDAGQLPQPAATGENKKRQ